jgi:hypothetical protein
MKEQEITHQITAFFAQQTEKKRQELMTVHALILANDPHLKCWFFDGTNDENRQVANPTIGYGTHHIHYANGSSREFFKVGLSANKTGMSIYFMAIKDKTYLQSKFGASLGKAKITGYCIRINQLKEVNLEVLSQLLTEGLQVES